MKTAKPPAVEGGGSSSRRAQPVRQTRINPPRNSSLHRGNSFTSAPVQEQPIDVFPGVTHFADAITALPKEIVRHFTLLKEVDAKIFQHEGKLFEKLRDALDTPPSVDTTSSRLHDASNSVVPGSTPMSVQASSVGAPTDLAPRRQLFLETGWKLQEMMVSLEEKNHVLLAANDALEKQMRRIDEIWPRLESEFSDEAKWGSTTHWAYVDNRQAQQQAKTNEKAERSRREAVATLSAAAQHLAEEAAARSNDRKQAIAAKKSNKTQVAEPDGDKSGEPTKKTQGAKSRKAAAEAAAPVGLGITTGAPAAPAPVKRRKVETAKTSNGATPAERAMSTVFGANTTKTKTTSPRETPVPESGPKKRKALPTSSGQAKKSRTNAAMSPSVTSSPVIGAFPELANGSNGSPVPPAVAPPRPVSSRARKNSTHNVESTPKLPVAEFSVRPNGNLQEALEPSQQINGAKANAGPKTQKETPTPVPSKVEPPKQETEIPTPVLEPPSNGNKKESTAKATAAAAAASTPVVEERTDSKKESTPLAIQPSPAAGTVKTKSGRASKPSTPALATFAEANSTGTAMVPSRSRPSRNNNINNNGDAASSSSSTTGPTTITTTVTTTTTTSKRSHKKGASISAAAALAAPTPGKEAATLAASATPAATATNRSSQQHKDQERLSQPQQPVLTSSQQDETLNQDDEEEPDGDEPRYCKCNGVSYGEMVACDGEGCPREWFHLECVGLKVAPKGNAKWYCDECKERFGSRGGRR